MFSKVLYIQLFRICWHRVWSRWNNNDASRHIRWFWCYSGKSNRWNKLIIFIYWRYRKTLKVNVQEEIETVEPIEETTEPIETKDVEEGETFKIEPQGDNPPVQETPIKTYRLQPTGNKILYHTTLTKNVDGILENGLKPLQTTLWTTPDGERHGNGEIYVFESLEDAKAWKIKMEFDLGEDATILQINNNTDMWEADIDEATGIPKNILGPDSGQWFRRFDTVPSEDIKVFNEGESFRLEPQQLENAYPFLEKALEGGMDNAMWYEASADVILGITGEM